MKHGVPRLGLLLGKGWQRGCFVYYVDGEIQPSLSHGRCGW
jgi:hypothetical protein